MITTIKKLQGILTRFIYLFLSKSSKPYVKVFPSYKILIFALVGFTLSDFFPGTDYPQIMSSYIKIIK